MATPIIIERILNAPATTVWKAITSKEEMKQWYFDLSAFSPEPGFEFQFAGQGRKGEKYIHLCKVLEVVQGKKLSYSWTYEGMEGYSVVTFELFEEGNKTRIKLTHEGLETFRTDNPDFAISSFRQGWTHIINKSLVNYVEGTNHH